MNIGSKHVLKQDIVLFSDCLCPNGIDDRFYFLFKNITHIF